MAINKNHEFEELNGVKCGIVEKNVKPERVEFLKKILEFNGFTVVVVPSPPPKTTHAPATAPVAAPATAEGASTPQPQTPQPVPPPPPETFTVGVTDYTFNPINAIFGRQLKNKEGHFITLAYWRQEAPFSDDEVPYYENTK